MCNNKKKTVAKKIMRRSAKKPIVWRKTFFYDEKFLLDFASCITICSNNEDDVGVKL